MERFAVKSHIIVSIGYDAATRTLQVEFPRRQKDAARAVYNYHDVPSERAHELLYGPAESGDGSKHSIGSYFLHFIKPNYKFTRIEEKDENQAQESPCVPPSD